MVSIRKFLVTRQVFCLHDHEVSYFQVLQFFSSVLVLTSSFKHAFSMAYTQLVRLSEVHASIHVLPPYILGEIFMFCVDSLIASYHPCIQPRAGVPPMLLCEVCRHWRAVMLSISTIWASVARRGHMHTQKHLSLYKMWLARSRRAPLSLEISELPKNYLDSVDEIISLFISEIHRWQFVWLRLEERDLFNRLLNIPDT